MNPSDIRIFLFHRVSDSEGGWGHATSVAMFERCVQYITRNFTVKTVEECLANAGKATKGSKPNACITFDDGFKDNIKYALPILDKYKIKASFYIVTGCIDKDLPTWPHLYYNLFENTGKLNLLIDSKHLGGGVDKKFSSKEDRMQYGSELLEKLKLVPYHEVEKVLDSIMQSFSDVPMPEKMMMSWDDIKQLSSAGFTIGSHTHSHPLLPLMVDDTRLMHELTYSAERIKDACGKLPETIAYPLGVTDDRVMKTAREAGYKYGLTVEQRFYSPAHDTNLMAIPRVDIYSDSGWFKTYLRLSGKMEMIKKILGR